MADFLTFMDKLVENFPLHISVGYSKTCDWTIRVVKQGCADDYPNSKRDGKDAVLCNIQDCDMQLAFAKAQVAVKDWLLENCGGY